MKKSESLEYLLECSNIELNYLLKKKGLYGDGFNYLTKIQKVVLLYKNDMDDPEVRIIVKKLKRKLSTFRETQVNALRKAAHDKKMLAKKMREKYGNGEKKSQKSSKKRVRKTTGDD